LQAKSNYTRWNIVASRPLVGTINREEVSMTHRLFLSAAIAALMAGSSLVHAQAPAGGAASGGTAAPSGASRSAPAAAPAPAASDRAAPAERTPPVNRDEATDTTNNSKTPDAAAGAKTTASDDKVQRDNGDVRATDATGDGKTKSGTQATDSKTGDPKANPNAKAAADSKTGTTTGQAAAGAKLSTEQRTKITTTIKQQNIKPVTNINFSISVGTRVPRDVSFHPLPAEIITVYPDWRGYEFFLVRDEIIVVNPRTLEIVAVLDA
jgi:hypothetical protein